MDPSPSVEDITSAAAQVTVEILPAPGYEIIPCPYNPARYLHAVQILIKRPQDWSEEQWMSFDRSHLAFQPGGTDDATLIINAFEYDPKDDHYYIRIHATDVSSQIELKISGEVMGKPFAETIIKTHVSPVTARIANPTQPANLHDRIRMTVESTTSGETLPQGLWTSSNTAFFPIDDDGIVSVEGYGLTSITWQGILNGRELLALNVIEVGLGFDPPLACRDVILESIVLGYSAGSGGIRLGANYLITGAPTGVSDVDRARVICYFYSRHENYPHQIIHPAFHVAHYNVPIQWPISTGATIGRPLAHAEPSGTGVRLPSLAARTHVRCQTVTCDGVLLPDVKTTEWIAD
jgi:hypothetical protein